MQQRRGIALMLVMVAVLVTGTMAVAYFGSTDNSVAIGTNLQSAARARAVAESGLELAIAILETDTEWQTQHVDGVLLSEFQFSEGVITISIVDANTDLPPTEGASEVIVTVTSSIGLITQTTQAIATVIPNEEEYDVDFSEYAIFASSQIEIDDVASVQTWQASPLSLQSNPLRLGTLATGPLSIDIDSPAQYSPLELHAPQSASSMISNTALDLYTFFGEPTFPAPPHPPEGGELLTLTNSHSENNSRHGNWLQSFVFGGHRNRSISSNNIIVQGGSYELDSLEIQFGQTVEIQGEVIVNIQDDMELSGAKIILVDDASLTIHVGGSVEITSSYIGNENTSTQSWMDPSRVQLFGHGDNDWEIDGLTTLKAELYAPQSEVLFEGLSTLCGRVAADEVSLQGASRLLYDPTLDNGGYADHDGPLYDDEGQLYSELSGLTELDANLINSIIDSISSEDYVAAANHWFDWHDEPTARPNDVIFMLLVYGTDTREWEELVRQARRNRGTMIAGKITR